MQIPELSLEELTAFGIRPEDEVPHAYDPDQELWNESWFWDFFNHSGELAGHCRIGMLPAQRRAWLWFFLYHDGEWVAVEEPRLPLSEFQLPRLAYKGWGLEVSWDASEPLRRGRFHFQGFGRVLSGPRTGQVQAVGADLEVRALAAPHSTGRGEVAGHSSKVFDSCRFEQPIALSGELSIGDQTFPFEGSCRLETRPFPSKDAASATTPGGPVPTTWSGPSWWPTATGFASSARTSGFPGWIRSRWAICTVRRPNPWAT